LNGCYDIYIIQFARFFMNNNITNKLKEDNRVFIIKQEERRKEREQQIKRRKQRSPPLVSTFPNKSRTEDNNLVQKNKLTKNS